MENKKYEVFASREAGVFEIKDEEGEVIDEFEYYNDALKEANRLNAVAIKRATEVKAKTGTLSGVDYVRKHWADIAKSLAKNTKITEIHRRALSSGGVSCDYATFHQAIQKIKLEKGTSRPGELFVFNAPFVPQKVKSLSERMAEKLGDPKKSKLENDVLKLLPEVIKAKESGFKLSDIYIFLKEEGYNLPKNASAFGKTVAKLLKEQEIQG